MRDDKFTITFDTPFRYSAGGAFQQGTTITVCEPAFEHRVVFRRMMAYVAQVQAAGARQTQASLLQVLSPDQLRVLGEARRDEAQQDGHVAAAPVVHPEITLDWFADLGPDEYVKFTDFLQKALTGNRALAYIGDDLSLALKDRLAVTDEVWMSLSDVAGMEAVERVLAGFAGFFLRTRPAPGQSSQTTSGSNSSASSVSLPPVPSPIGTA